MSVKRYKFLGYSPLKPPKIFGLFLLCSGHSLETPSIDVFFSSDRTKLLVVSLR